MKFLPNLNDIPRSQFDRQFSRAPADAFFTTGAENKLFMVHYIHASGAWTLDYINLRGEQETLSGPAAGAIPLHWPFAFRSIVASASVTRLGGFFMDIPRIT